MTEQDAEVLLKAALETSQILHILAADLSDRLDDIEARAARLNIGHVLGEIGERLLDPVFAEHPRYKPEDTGDAWRELCRKVGARDMLEG